MKRRGFLRALGLGGLGVALPAEALARNGAARWHERMAPLMGTFASVAVYTEDHLAADIAIDSCFAEMRRVEGLITDWNATSETSQLNMRRALRLPEVSSELISLTLMAETIRQQTGGSFNPLSRELTLRWREARETQKLPSRSKIAQAIEASAKSAARIEEGSLRIHGRAELEFGGIGKGFVVDAGVRVLRQLGVRFARVAGSGDLRFLGAARWSVDIEHPREERLLGTIALDGEVGVATSGDYRSVAEISGERFHHLLNLSNGRPCRWNQAVTVVAPSAMLADAYSTAAFSMPTAEAITFLNGLPQVEGLVVDHNGLALRTRGLKIIQAQS